MALPAAHPTDGPLPEPTAAPAPEVLARLVDELVDECRVGCLWSYRPDYYPRSDEERRAVLDAIQELTRLAVQTSTGDRSRLMLDIDGFRAGRRKELTALAEKLAEQAKTTGSSIKLDPMNAFERKINHDTIQTLGLTSESDGEDPNRFVVIYPA